MDDSLNEKDDRIHELEGEIEDKDKDLLLEPEKIQADTKAQSFMYADRQKFLDDIRKGIINTPEGRRFLWDLLGLLGYQKPKFNPDPMIMAKNCGIHDDVLLVVLRDIEEAHPGILFKMQNEFRRR